MPVESKVHTDYMRRESSGERKDEKKNFGMFYDERGYLDQIDYILHHGQEKGDRTGTGVKSVFGTQARYSLRGWSFLIVVPLQFKCIHSIIHFLPLKRKYGIQRQVEAYTTGHLM
uniref:Thymidylate synthase n=1 Tax=Mola mola TaxID=94237 RepID=A0A3Q3XFG0_MOLML